MGDTPRTDDARCAARVGEIIDLVGHGEIVPADVARELERELAQTNVAFKAFHRNLCERFGYEHDDADWRRDLASLEEHIAKNLPDGMEDRQILFKECERGHGRLTAANWIDHGCPTCERDALREELDTAQGFLLATQAECRRLNEALAAELGALHVVKSKAVASLEKQRMDAVVEAAANKESAELLAWLEAKKGGLNFVDNPNFKQGPHCWIDGDGNAVHHFHGKTYREALTAARNAFPE